MYSEHNLHIVEFNVLRTLYILRTNLFNTYVRKHNFQQTDSGKYIGLLTAYCMEKHKYEGNDIVRIYKTRDEMYYIRCRRKSTVDTKKLIRVITGKLSQI